MGYHLKEIQRGVIGERTKIIEEFDEWLDACDQNSAIMELVELSDMMGAINAYISKYYNLTLADLIKMSTITARAFEDGTRKPRE
jgi:hypothetical protein